MFRRLSLPLAMLPMVACFGDFDCGPLFGDCSTNADCREDQQCRSEPFSWGSFCHDATFCETDADCPSSEVCETRPDESAQNPFDVPTPREPWCVCNGFGDCSPLGGAGGAGGGSPFEVGGGGAGGGGGGGGSASGGGGNGGAP